ncbi:MAG: hypothetical protein IJB97_10260, partial [Clostridia bacterium]|nr:hypothetical protein [Clostridia bacterium]
MKKAKFLGLILAAGIVAGGFLPLNQIQTQAQTLDDVDAQLLEFIRDDLGTDEKIRFSYTPLFDETLTESGRDYAFTVGNRSGYALMKAFTIGENTVYEIEELFYDKTSPFEDCDGLPVYVAHRTYLSYQDEAFYDIASETELTELEVAAVVESGFGYQGSIGTFVEQTQTISYATKDTSVSYSIPYDLPNYTTMEETASCANTAGAIIIGYYDRFYEGLIPNFQAYDTLGSVVIYKTASDEIGTLVGNLHALMDTDASQQGTTFAGFQAGMEAYVEDKGYTYTTSSVLTSGAFDFTKYKNAVEAQKPVALFLSGYA